MKILFVQPGQLESSNQYPPVGILYLASVARESGYIVDFYDGGAEGQSLDTALKFAIDFQPDIVCLSLYTIGLTVQFKFLNKLKNAIPGIINIVGGAHATALPVQTMQECTSIDFLVFGEGERTIVELLEAIKNQISVGRIKGSCYRDNGNIIQNEARELIEDLDEIPLPAFDLLKTHRFQYTRRSFNISNRIGVIISSRGCPFNCSFCFKSTFGTELRRRSPQRVVAEMKWQIEVLGVEEIQFLDDLFAINSKWLNDFFDELLRQDVKVPWKCLARVTSVTEDDLLKMRKHGCYGVEFGVESGNDEILKKANKKITTRQIKKAFQSAKKAGLVTFGFFIFGLENDSHQTVRETLELAKKILPDVCGFAILLPFPGSKVHACLPDDLKHKWERFNSYYDKNSLPFSICSIAPKDLLIYGAQANDEVDGSGSYLLLNVILRKSRYFLHRTEAFSRWYSAVKKNIKRSVLGERIFIRDSVVNFFTLTRDMLLFSGASLVVFPYRIVIFF